MSVFNEYGDPLWIRFLGGRKFAMAIIVLVLAACAFFCTEKFDGYQFGGLMTLALGLYSWNNRKQKAITSENPSHPVETPQK
jgi:hypothetical protein